MFNNAFENPVPGDPLRFPFAICLVQFFASSLGMPVVVLWISNHRCGDPWAVYLGIFNAVFCTWAFLFNVKQWGNRVRDHSEQMARQIEGLRSDLEQLRKGAAAPC